MTYVPKHFRLEEIFPKKMVKKFNPYFLWGLMNEGLMRDLDSIREYFNKPVFVNFGEHECRGYRDCIICKNVGSDYSMHRFGCAIDFNVEGMEVREVRSAILKKQHLFPYIKRMERGIIENGKRKPINWIHIDIKPTNKEGIYLFYG